MSERRASAPGPVRPSHIVTAGRPPAGLSGASGIPARDRSRHDATLRRWQLQRLVDRRWQLCWSTGLWRSPARPVAGAAATPAQGCHRTGRVWGQDGDDVLITGGRQLRTGLPARTWGRRDGLLPSAGGTTAGLLRCSNAALSTCPQRLLLFPGEVFLSSFNTNTWGQAHLPTSVPPPPGTPGAATPRPRLDRCGVTHPAFPAPGRHKHVEVDSLEVHD